MKTLLAISASLSEESCNSRIIKFISKFVEGKAKVTNCNNLEKLPHFRPEIKDDQIPIEVLEFRKLINSSDGIIISTPEYVFSIPSILKNALEWTVATTVFLNKPVFLITASTSGVTAHESLKLIMKTLTGKLDENHCILISGVKSKIKEDIESSDPVTINEIRKSTEKFLKGL